MLRRRVAVKSVEILAKTVKAEIAIHHTIRIDHGNDVENKGLKQEFCFGAVGEEEHDKTIENMARCNFSRMHPSTYENTLN